MGQKIESKSRYVTAEVTGLLDNIHLRESLATELNNPATAHHSVSMICGIFFTILATLCKLHRGVVRKLYMWSTKAGYNIEIVIVLLGSHTIIDYFVLR